MDQTLTFYTSEIDKGLDKKWFKQYYETLGFVDEPKLIIKSTDIILLECTNLQIFIIAQEHDILEVRFEQQETSNFYLEDDFRDSLNFYRKDFILHQNLSRER